MFVDTPRKINNPDYLTLDCEPLEVRMRTEVGLVLPPQRLADAPHHIAALCAQRDQFVEKISQARARWIYNVGSSGRVGANAVLDVLTSARDAHAHH